MSAGPRRVIELRALPRTMSAFVAMALALSGAAAGASFTERDGVVSIEAEHCAGTTGGWSRHTDDPKAGGGAYMKSLVRRNRSKRIEFPVTFGKAGRYRVWLRAKCTSDKDNDCYVLLDGRLGEMRSDSGWVKVSGIKTDRKTFGWQGTAKTERHTPRKVRDRGTWINVALAGRHIVALGSRSVDFKVDKICLVHESKAYRPSGDGPAETAAAGPGGPARRTEAAGSDPTGSGRAPHGFTSACAIRRTGHDDGGFSNE